MSERKKLTVVRLAGGQKLKKKSPEEFAKGLNRAENKYVA